MTTPIKLLIWLLIIVPLYVQAFCPSKPHHGAVRGWKQPSTAEAAEVRPQNLVFAGSKTITAYVSFEAFTDQEPCLSASGTDVCKEYAEGKKIIAANEYPFGTKLRIEGMGDYTVADRMAEKNYGKIDLYMGYDLQGARNWGVQQRKVYLIK